MDLKLLLLCSALCASFPTLGHAKDAQASFGGSKGADLSLAAIQPDNARVSISKAGDEPTDIARYLLAKGVSSTRSAPMAVSPDGKTIAFVSKITGQDELWTVPIEGGQPTQVTFLTQVSGAIWAPDGGSLFYLADRDGNEQPGFFTITADGKQEHSVLPAQRGDFRQFGSFADDGSFLFSSTARDGQTFDVYRGTLDGQSELIAKSKLGYAAKSLAPNGKYGLVTEVVGEDADNLFLLDMRSKTMRAVAQPPVDQRANHTNGGFAWLPDSSAVYFSSNEGREFNALSRYDLATGKTTTLFASSADVGNIKLCGAGARFITWTENNDGFDTIKAWDRDRDVAVSIPALPEGKYQLDCRGDAAKLAIVINGWQTPGAIWTIDLAASLARRVFAANLAGLDPERLVRPRSVRFPARDGVMLQGLLYLPTNATKDEPAPPVLFSVHGGPAGQASAEFDPRAQYLVNQGVAVFKPNVRGSTGLGRTYSTLDDREKRLNSVRDLVDLLKSLGAARLVDADRAVVEGGSYGGYAVNAVLAAYPGTFAAGISEYGVADWISALEVASPSLKASDIIEYGDIADPKWREFYRLNSPIRQADKIRVPVLFSHGMQDPRIDISETETMVKALRANGIEAPFIRIPDEGHGWSKLNNLLFYYRKEAEFIRKRLGIAPAVDDKPK